MWEAPVGLDLRIALPLRTSLCTADDLGPSCGLLEGRLPRLDRLEEPFARLALVGGQLQQLVPLVVGPKGAHVAVSSSNHDERVELHWRPNSCQRQEDLCRTMFGELLSQPHHGSLWELQQMTTNTETEHRTMLVECVLRLFGLLRGTQSNHKPTHNHEDNHKTQTSTS